MYRVSAQERVGLTVKRTQTDEPDLSGLID